MLLQIDELSKYAVSDCKSFGKKNFLLYLCLRFFEERKT